MMSYRFLLTTALTAAVASLALTACSSAPATKHYASAAAQPAVQPAAAPVAASDSVVVLAPDGTILETQSGNSPAYRADVEACYSYAAAQVAHDARIETDVNAAFDSSAQGSGLAELRGRMNNFERSQRRPALFNNCMASKGYASN